MRFKELNEAIERLLEGDVVSFTDYKRKKEGNLDNTVYVDISMIRCENTETAAGNRLPLNIQKGMRYTYEQFQDAVYKNDTILKKIDDTIKIQFTARIFLQFGNQDKVSEAYDDSLVLGTQAPNDIQAIIERRIRHKHSEIQGTDEIVFIQQRVERGNYDKELDQFEQPKQHNVQTLEGTHKNSNEFPEVGDIIYYTYGYDSTHAKFFRITDVLKASIKLQRLEYTYTSGDWMNGEVAPIDKVIDDKDVDGKTFRINNVAKINGHYADYWNGNPVAVDSD